MPRLVAAVIILLILAIVSFIRPSLVASWFARGWSWSKRVGFRPSSVTPPWVTYYLNDLPDEVMPQEARSLEEFIRASGGVLLILPIVLGLAIFVLGP